MEGKPFTAYTDHKPLTFAIGNSAVQSPSQTRHLSFISEFTTDKRHLSGKQNVVADALSRVNTVGANGIAVSSIDHKQLAIDQQSSPAVTAYRTAISGLNLQDVQLEDDTLLCDISTGTPRPILPKAWTNRVFDAIHNLAHSGVKPTQRVVSARYAWHGMRKDIQQWCKECHHCQSSKIHRHVHAPLSKRDPPAGRFCSLHIDLVGPLPPSEGMMYLLTIIDRFTRWPEAIPLPDAKTETVARGFLRHWVKHFGVPDDIVSDRGPQFTSELWKELHKVLGIAASTTPAYHPQANGMVEHLHRQLKSALMATTNGPHWMDELPFVILGLHTAWREDPGCTPAQLVYGTNLHVPGEFLPSANTRQVVPTSDFLHHLQTTMRSVLPPPPSHHGQRPTQVPANLSST